MNFFKKHFYAIIFTLCLAFCNVYVLLKVFVLSTKISTVSDALVSNDTTEEENTDIELDTTSSEPVITDTSYKDENISIQIDTIYEYNTYIYIADVEVSSSEYLRTALAKDTFGTNVTENTSTIAKNNDAILAINGDYYGANSKGYVIKNGISYRESVRSDTNYDDLVIYDDGSFKIINEKDVSVSELLSSGVTQLFAFGPTLINDGQIVISQNTEVAKSMNSNPRTAIGIIDKNHYLFVVSDGRTSTSSGLSLYELATIMNKYGCEIAYNLDGGGSSTMYFNGNIINNPTTSGNSIKERAVSDIVYIGY